MAVQNTPTTLSAYLKEIYADQILSLVPEGIKVTEAIDFVESEKEPGGHYNQPVQLTGEFGFSAGSGAFALNAAVAHQSANAQVNGSSVLLRSVISYDAAARASTSKKAFMKWSETKFIPMLSSFRKRLEILALYGQMGIGKISGAPTVSNTVDAACVIDSAQWATGIWAGSEGMPVQIYTALTAGTNHTANVAAYVKTVDIANKTVTFTCANGTDANALASGDYIFFYGFRGNEMAGLAAITANAGTLFNVSASTYSLWAANSQTCSSAALNMTKLLKGAALPVGKGLEEKLTVFLSPGAYTNVNSDLAALRKFDGSYSKKKLSNGTEALEFHGVNGTMELVPSIYIKEGHAIGIPTKQCMRIGGTDITMAMPGQPAEQLVLQVPDYAAYEMRLYTEQAVFCQRPGWMIEWTNIVNA